MLVSFYKFFKSYPNPLTGDIINILFGQVIEEVLVVLYNPIGEVIYSKIILNEDRTAIDTMGKLSPGIYLIIGSNKNELFNKKLIVK